MYVVARPAGRWEVRESRATPSGPRSTTLASFSVLDADAISKALERATGAGDVEGLLTAARRAGAPIAEDPTLAAAAKVVSDLFRGADLPKNRAAVLSAALGSQAGAPTEREQAAAWWLGASPEQHGSALRDLLDLAQALPHRHEGELRFPPLTPVKP